MGTERLLARPGRAVRAVTFACLLVWAGTLLALSRLPGVDTTTFFSAVAMLLLFAGLLAGQTSTSVRVGPDGLEARTLFRRVRCRWPAVRRVTAQRILPGLTYYLVSTAAGPVAFSSLWRRHRELLAAVRERARLA